MTSETVTIRNKKEFSKSPPFLVSCQDYNNTSLFPPFEVRICYLEIYIDIDITLFDGKNIDS